MIILSHGICSSAIFYGINLSYERFRSRSLLVIKGVSLLRGVFCYLLFLVVCANMSVPPSFNFFSELIFMLAFLGHSILIKVILGFLFFFVGIYNVFFYVSLNHGGLIDL